MSTAGDRLAVPTNGHHPALTDDSADLPPAREPDARPDPAPAAPTVSPGQVIAGFAILAALIILVIGRRRGGRG